MLLTAALQPHLKGTTLLVSPLQESDREPLYEMAQDPTLWEQHPDRYRYRRDRYEVFFDGAMASGGALIARRHDTGQVVAASRYYEWNSYAQEVAIGYTVIRKSHWGDGTNTELKHLMLNHAFTWANAVWFHVAADNYRSRRAVEKLGAENAFEGEKEMAGIAVPYVYYRIVRELWLAR